LTLPKIDRPGILELAVYVSISELNVSALFSVRGSQPVVLPGLQVSSMYTLVSYIEPISMLTVISIHVSYVLCHTHVSSYEPLSGKHKRNTLRKWQLT